LGPLQCYYLVKTSLPLESHIIKTVKGLRFPTIALKPG
jgi:hypothetical protein